MRFPTKMFGKMFVLFIAVLIVSFCCFIGINYIWISSKSLEVSSRRKIILDWTTFFGTPLTDSYFNSCPELKEKCEIQSHKKYLMSADAVVFHSTNINWKFVPPKRLASQRYVFFTHESAANAPVVDHPSRNFFNWTMTIRSDSDIPWPYARTFIKKRSTQPTEITADFLGNKTKEISWFVSNCNTPGKRETYVAELRKYISVDTYGQCGNLQCPKEKSWECLLNATRDYKFLLSFENSLCRDYITEKVWTPLTLNIIVVLLKSSHLAHLLPPKSFIAADQFDSPKALADRLKQVGSDPQLYAEYFQWRNEYEIGNDQKYGGSLIGICRLCEMLWNKSAPVQVYESMYNWWVVGSKCDNTFVNQMLLTH